MWTTRLLEPGVVVGGHPGQHGDLVATQAWRAAAHALGQPDIARHQGGASSAQEIGQLGAIHSLTHIHHCAVRAPPEPGIGGPPMTGLCRRVGNRPKVNA